METVFCHSMYQKAELELTVGNASIDLMISMYEGTYVQPLYIFL